jgi:nitrogen-specific signal transduction histidine kinase
MVHIARDLTEQKQLEAEYRHAQKMEAMGTLAGGIAHDFNNLLTIVSGYAEIIRMDEEIPRQKREFADTILQASQRGAALSRQLLTFSRKEVAKSEKPSISLNDVALDVRKMLQRVLPINVTNPVRLASDLHRIKGSADQLNQILMNLAVNAFHAMPDGGELMIATRNATLDSGYCRLHPDIQPGEFVLLEMSDTGHGMDQKTMQRIYEPFFTTKKVGEGTGLGMSVVYGIVKEHGGHILCYSEVGVGTTFKIYFPELCSHDNKSVMQTATKPALLDGSETILIVDDEASIRNLLHASLTEFGYTTITASDGESAIVRLHEAGDRIGLVILDLGMPGMGGWECLKRLRGTYPKLPVLITTGYGGGNYAERARQEGAVGLISKPYEKEPLLRTIREILDAS